MLTTLYWPESVKRTLIQYLNDKGNASDFFFKFVLPLVANQNNITVNFRGKGPEKDILDLCVNDIQWCMFSKDNGIQILPHGKRQVERNSHINSNESVYGINNWLKGKRGTSTNELIEPYVYIKYPETSGFENEIARMLEKSLNFIQEL